MTTRPDVGAAPGAEPAPPDDAALDERLSHPDARAVAALGACPGDVIVLGAGGKMGPTLARMARRAADALGDGRRVTAVSRFASEGAERALRDAGVETVRADLSDRRAVAALPDAPNVVYMAGQKFGTGGAPHVTWGMNVVVPALCAERYAGARIVAFSTGNVYPLVPVDSGGARETDGVAPVGEYAASCVGRERVFEFFAERDGTRVVLVRLNYAVDLRYGVLVDLALRVWRGEPVDLTTGYVNVIWQGDANALALALLPHAASPPLAVNVTGSETLRVRDVAERLGALLGRAPRFTGVEAPDALLSSAERLHGLVGAERVPAATLVDWVADWVRRGGTVLGKPTRFDVRDGRF